MFVYMTVHYAAYVHETVKTLILLDRTHSFHHTALSEISHGIVGKNITTNYWITRTIFLPTRGLQIFLSGVRDSLVRSQSTECQLCEDNAETLGELEDIQCMVLTWCIPVVVARLPL